MRIRSLGIMGSFLIATVAASAQTQLPDLASVTKSGTSFLEYGWPGASVLVSVMLLYGFIRWLKVRGGASPVDTPDRRDYDDAHREILEELKQQTSLLHGMEQRLSYIEGHLGIATAPRQVVG